MRDGLAAITLIMNEVIKIRRSTGFPKLGLSEFWAKRELLYYLVWRDFKVRHKQTVLGYLWMILQPLALMVLFTLFFSRMARIPSEGVPYPVFVLAALVPWRFFATSLSAGASSVVKAAGLIRQVYFPRLFLPVAGVFGGAINMLAAFMVLIAVMYYFGFFLSVRTLLIPILLLLLALLGLAVSLILASLNTYFRDVSQTLPIITQAWLYASPIVYPLSVVPESIRTIYCLNPMVGIIQTFRWAVIGRGVFPYSELYVSVCVSVVLLVLGLVMFKKFERNFVDAI